MYISMYHYQRREKLLGQNFKNCKFLNRFERNGQSRRECFYFGLPIVISGTGCLSDSETEKPLHSCWNFLLGV